MEKSRDLAMSTGRTLVPEKPSRIAKVTMIIACPACDTRYAVPETAIGAEGRTVRCAKCKHSWFQEPKPFDLTSQEADTLPESDAPPPAANPATAPAKPEPEVKSESEAESDDQSVEGPSVSHWKTTDRAPDKPAQPIASRALRQGLADQSANPNEKTESEQQSTKDDLTEPPTIDTGNDPLAAEGEQDYMSGADAFDDSDYEEQDTEEVSQFEYSPPFTTRRNPVKMWTAAAAIFALLATGTVFAVNYYGLPSWLPIDQPTFGIGKPELELEFPPEEQRTETLESGEKIFRVRGTITNSGRETISVPSLLVVFRDERKRRVQDSVVVPAKSSLAPGESLNVTEAIADIAPTAKNAEIGWSPS